jgi:hypothetical protein
LSSAIVYGEGLHQHEGTNVIPRWRWSGRKRMIGLFQFNPSFPGSLSKKAENEKRRYSVSGKRAVSPLKVFRDENQTSGQFRSGTIRTGCASFMRFEGP